MTAPSNNLGPQPPSDEQLAQAVLDGHAEAFRTLIDRHHDNLLGFLIRMLSDRALAEDVFQDTFLQVHQSLKTFDTTRRFKPWLFAIAANKARDALRKIKRKPATPMSTFGAKDEDGASFVDVLSMDVPPVSSRAEAEERSQVVQAAIEELTPSQREVLLMAYFQQLTYQQLSEALDIPMGTVKSRLHGAVAAFAKKYQAQVELRAKNSSINEDDDRTDLRMSS